MGQCTLLMLIAVSLTFSSQTDPQSQNLSRTDLGFFLNAINVISTGNLTTECLEDVILIADAVSKLLNNQTTPMKYVLLQILDSNGARGAGILRSGFKFYGFKQECDLIHYKVPGRNRPFTTMYSRAFINITLKDFSALGDCNGKYDLCQPASCTSNDLEILIDTALIMIGVTKNPVCGVITMDDITMPYTYPSWIVGAVIVTVAALVVVAGIIDYFEFVDRAGSSVPIKMLLAFSIYTNTLDIFNMADPKPGQITSLNCIRALSIFWVISCHTIIPLVFQSYNPLDFASTLDYPMFQVFQNSYLSVDSFFFIAGLMVSYMWFKNLKKNKRVLTDSKSWIMFYLHRFLRLSPPYYMSIFFYTYLSIPYTSRSPFNLRYPVSKNGCLVKFWHNLLYVNNIYVKPVCNGASWYLATDMQLYILSPLILISLALFPYGIVVPAALWCLSIVANIVTIYIHDWYPSCPIRLTGFTPSEDYHRLVYAAAWIRCPVYIQGMVLGWFMHRVKHLHIPSLLNCAMGGLAFALMLTVLFGLFDYNKGGEMSLFWRAIYSAFSKPAWGLGLTWIIGSSFYGYGGPINRFMSWPIWNPLGRLTYCMYLFQMPVIGLLFALQENPTYYTNIWSGIIFFLIPAVVLSVAAAYIWSLLFEIPIGKLEIVLIRPMFQRKSSQPS